MKNQRETWDALRAKYLAAYEAARDLEIKLSARYLGASQSWLWRGWITKGEKSRLETLETRRDKLGEKVVAMIVAISPRGERWLSGVPVSWLRGDLTFDDAMRPIGEPLSVEVPLARGWTREDQKRSLG